MSLLKRVGDWWWQVRAGRKVRFIVCGDSGVSVDQASIAWDDIGAVLAYKRDCYAYDLICVGLVDRDGHVLAEISEQDAGYKDLVRELPIHLSGCLTLDEWFMKVAFPAFETQATQLYRRQPQPAA